MSNNLLNLLNKAVFSHITSCKNHNHLEWKEAFYLPMNQQSWIQWLPECDTAVSASVQYSRQYSDLADPVSLYLCGISTN